jgi:signal transduction histidine kinase
MSLVAPNHGNSVQVGVERARRRVQVIFLVCAIALLLPLDLLVSFTVRQLRSEKYFQYRTWAAEAIERLNTGIAGAMAIEENRSFDQYTFLNIASNSLVGQQAVKFSPLAEPVSEGALPGVVGYFQINPDGVLGTPLLPPDSEGEAGTMGRDELARRREILARMRTLLSGTELLSLRGDRTPGAPPVKVQRTEKLNISPVQNIETFTPQSANNVIQTQNIEVQEVTAEVGGLQARRLAGSNLVLYRSAWKGKERFLQGMVVDLKEFLKHTVSEQFAGTDFGSRCRVSIQYENAEFLNLGPFKEGREEEARPVLVPLFEGQLAPPLDNISVAVSAERIPYGRGANLVGTLVVILMVAIPVTLFFLYQSALAQIELARERGNFVSSISHELRTPLTSIRMYSEMLKEGWVGEESQKKVYYEYIFSESERLSRLIGSILRFSGSRGDQTLSLEKISISSLQELVVQRGGAIAHTAGFELESIEPHELFAHTMLEVDVDAFLTIAINLIENSLKFAAASLPRRVEFGFDVRGAEAIFHVRDFGPGVARGELNRIFDLFHRGEDEMTRSTRGTGIGLALVRELAGAMSASVRAMNSNPGLRVEVVFKGACQTGPTP